MLKEMDYLKLSTVQVLKERFKSSKKELKEKQLTILEDFQSFVIKKEPLYDCPEGYKKVYRAWYGTTPDIRLTELIEQLNTETI